MHIKQHYRVIAILFCLLLALVFGGVGAYNFYHSLLPGSQKAVATPHVIVPTATPVPRRLTRLVIPSVGINASIEDIGLITGGYLAVPTRNQWDDVGWYRFGPYPGDHGSAVIDGHLDRPGGLPAVFWNLHKLQVGNIVMVTDSLGETLHFRVNDVESYTPQSAPL